MSYPIPWIVRCQGYLTRVRRLLQEPLSSLPVVAQTVAGRCLVFRMLSRNASAVQALLSDVHRQCPFSLCAVLDGQPGLLRQIPVCCQDALTRKFLATYPGDALRSSAAVATCASIMTMMDIDVLDIEAKHATSRRLTVMQSTQTWPLEFSLLSAEFATRQQALLINYDAMPSCPRYPWFALVNSNCKYLGNGLAVLAVSAAAVPHS